VNQGTPWVTITLILLDLAMYAGELQRKTFQGSMAMIGDGMSGPDGSLYHTLLYAPPGLPGPRTSRTGAACVFPRRGFSARASSPPA
jgi:hypothetical protein